MWGIPSTFPPGALIHSAMAQEDLLKQGQRIWEMLDEMAATNPEGYKKFIKKQMTEGVEVLKPPQPVMALHCKTAEVSKQQIVEPV